jgi:diguanylate cyclase (GGDEF)-like protein
LQGPDARHNDVIAWDWRCLASALTGDKGEYRVARTAAELRHSPGVVRPSPARWCSSRRSSAGALIVWAITSAAYSVAASVADPHYPATHPVYPLSVHLLVAMVTGTQSSALATQISDLQVVRRALHHQVGHDGLTGLPNRATLAAHAAQHDGDALAVLLLDLNGFKQVNDTLGHAAGDRLLQEVAVRLGNVVRDQDMAGRLGGDEFLVVIPYADVAATEMAADRIRAAVSVPIAIAGEVVQVTASVGAALRPAGADVDLEMLTQQADARMYEAKRQSPGRRERLIS